MIAAAQSSPDAGSGPGRAIPGLARAATRAGWAGFIPAQPRDGIASAAAFLPLLETLLEAPPGPPATPAGSGAEQGGAQESVEPDREADLHEEQISGSAHPAMVPLPAWNISPEQPCLPRPLTSAGSGAQPAADPPRPVEPRVASLVEAHAPEQPSPAASRTPAPVPTAPDGAAPSGGPHFQPLEPGEDSGQDPPAGGSVVFQLSFRRRESGDAILSLSRIPEALGREPAAASPGGTGGGASGGPVGLPEEVDAAAAVALRESGDTAARPASGGTDAVARPQVPPGAEAARRPGLARRAAGPGQDPEPRRENATAPARVEAPGSARQAGSAAAAESGRRGPGPARPEPETAAGRALRPARAAPGSLSRLPSAPLDGGAPVSDSAVQIPAARLSESGPGSAEGQPPAEAAPPEPSLPPVAVEPARRLSVEVQGPDDGPRLTLNLTERRGEVRVEVRGGDPALQEALRQDLPDLVSRLEGAGYRTEGAGRDGAGLEDPAGLEPGWQAGSDEERGRRHQPAWPGGNRPRQRNRSEETFAWHLRSIGRS